jgi:hypothetical protein
MPDLKHGKALLDELDLHRLYLKASYAQLQSLHQLAFLGKDLSGGDTIATAAAVQDTLARRWSETNYESRSVAIACFTVDDGDADDDEPGEGWVRRQVHDHDGFLVDVAWPCVLTVFPRLVEAVAFSTLLRHRLDKRVRIGVNLGEFLVAPDGRLGPGPTFAKWLMEQSEPGGMCVSAVTDDLITSRIGASEDGKKNERAWRSIVLAALQWAGLLGYFLGWFYLIFWKISYFASHGSYPCWPQWLCD